MLLISIARFPLRRYRPEAEGKVSGGRRQAAGSAHSERIRALKGGLRMRRLAAMI
jgi:hypothetical protein